MTARDLPFPIVGIGASAGGVEALQAVFRAMPDPPPAMGFVVVTHLGANHESSLPAILGECTGMPVVSAHDGDHVEPGHAYVLPYDAVITIVAGRLILRRQSPDAPRERQPIDVFLASLAKDLGELAVGIVLSGSGSDGTLGLKAIKERDGLTLAQGTDGTAPRYPSMPDSAIAGGVVDFVLSAEDIPTKLVELTRGLSGLEEIAGGSQNSDQDAAARQETICEILRSHVGHDFSGYKGKTFFRRVQRRMQVVRARDLAGYVECLRHDPAEAGKLFHDLLIGVTGFFRDPDAFTALATRVIPTLFEARNSDDTIRIWVPGCATGEEAYSLAILLSEQVDHLPGGPRVQVFATDIDDAALAVARRGRYPAAMMDGVTPERLARFFVSDGAAYVVSRALRDLCVFSSHSIIRDPPFSRIDLVSCRNLLIYLGGQLQEQVIPLFHYALRPAGFLFLGVSENIARHNELFWPVDKAHRIFQRREHATSVVPLQVQTVTQGVGRQWPSTQVPRRTHPGNGAELRQMAESVVLENFSPPHVLINGDGDVVYQSARLRRYLELPPGVPNRQLLSMARRGLKVDLRLALSEAKRTRHTVVRPNVEIEGDGIRQAVELTVVPVPTRDGAEPLFLVIFADAGPSLPKDETPLAVNAVPSGDGIVEQLELDLRDTRERLQSMAEEYETATEELKSANEEMVSVNEELQSINEELETSKEELQSVNEEQRATNFELASKVEELDLANADLRNLFDSTQIATVFLDKHLVIRNFTPAVTAIFDLVPSDRGRPLTSFTNHLDRVDLRQELRQVLGEREVIERRVTTRDGVAHYLMRMLPYRTAESVVDGVVLTFFDVTKVVEGEVLGTLVDELNHRVRNMLQVVSSVAARTLRRAASLEEFGTTFNARLRALGRAHELGSLDGGSVIPMLDLVMKELQPYATGSDRISAEGPPIRLKSRVALSLGMVLHEMATNAAKYGALSSDLGRVTVTWLAEGTGPVERLILHWVEAGGPKVEKLPKRRGFGSKLIERQLRHDLGGTIDIDYAEAGVRMTLTLPIGIIAGRDPKVPEGNVC